MNLNNQLYKIDKLNCEVFYYQQFLTEEESHKIFNFLNENFHFNRQRVSIDDQHSYKLNRSTLIFTDKETIEQNIIPKTWGKETPIIQWPDLIFQIKEKIEKLTDKKYNICLCNYYLNGKRNIGWHSDKEEYGSISSIASISLGASRNFLFRKIENNNDIHNLILCNGSLLIMGQGCQENYQHCLPLDKTINQPRINLTFRLFDKNRYNL